MKDLIGAVPDTCAPPPACDVAKELAAAGVEILYATEPAADTTGLPDAYPAPLPPVVPALGGTAAPVTGGASNNTAVELKPGLFSDSLLGAETKFYKIPVGYGQRLSFKATVTADGASAGAIGRA